MTQHFIAPQSPHKLSSCFVLVHFLVSLYSPNFCEMCHRALTMISHNTLKCFSHTTVFASIWHKKQTLEHAPRSLYLCSRDSNRWWWLLTTSTGVGHIPLPCERLFVCFPIRPLVSKAQAVTYQQLGAHWARKKTLGHGAWHDEGRHIYYDHKMVQAYCRLSL